MDRALDLRGLALPLHAVLATVACMALAALWAVQFYSIANLYVDVPYGDEWDVLWELSPQFSSSRVSWLFIRHGDHLTVPTRLLYLAALSTGGLNFAILAQINFLLFGVTVALFIFVLIRLIPTVPLFVIAPFTAFALSARAYENHGFAFQNCIHFCLLFFFLACFFLFVQRTLWRNALAGVACILTSLSFGTGLPMILVLGLAHLASVLAIDKRGTRLAMATVTATWMIAAVTITALFWSAVPGQRLTFPNDLRFWQFLFSLMSSGFGIDFDSIIAWPAAAASGITGLICLLVVLAPLGLSLYRTLRSGDLGSFPFGLLALTAGLLAAVATVSAGRAGWWQDNLDGKSSRYTEITVFLLPICAAWYWTILASKVRLFAITALFAITFALFANDWEYERTYAGFLEPRKIGVDCIARYYRSGERPICNEVYNNGSWSLEPNLDFFRDMNFTFVRATRSAKEPNAAIHDRAPP